MPLRHRSLVVGIGLCVAFPYLGWVFFFLSSYTCIAYTPAVLYQ